MKREKSEKWTGRAGGSAARIGAITLTVQGRERGTTGWTTTWAVWQREQSASTVWPFKWVCPTCKIAAHTTSAQHRKASATMKVGRTF